MRGAGRERSRTERVDHGVSELACSRRAPVERERPLARALERGGWHGAWTVIVGTTPSALLYFARWHDLEMPWAVLGVQLTTFAAVCGALYCGPIALGVALGRRAPRARFAARLAWPALGGALGGLAPGGFAGLHFGSVAAPFFGTAEILGAGVLAFFLFGIAILRPHAGAKRAAVGLALALVPVGIVVAGALLFSPALGGLADTMVLDTANIVHDLIVFGAAFGALVGFLFGALVGLASALAER